MRNGFLVIGFLLVIGGAFVLVRGGSITTREDVVPLLSDERDRNFSERTATEVRRLKPVHHRVKSIFIMDYLHTAHRHHRQIWRVRLS